MVFRNPQMTVRRVNPPRLLLRHSCLSIAVAIGMVATNSAVLGAEPSRSLENIEQNLDAARKQELDQTQKALRAEAEIKKLRHRSIAIAARSQEHELTIQKLENRLNVLETDRKNAVASLKSRRQQLAGMLAALQRIAMHPPVALIALPMAPVDTIRSALLLRRTVPAVDEASRALREDLIALAELSEAVNAARNKITIEFAALTRQQGDLHRLMSRKAALAQNAHKERSNAQRRAAQLGREARDLKDLIARLADQSKRQKQANRRIAPQLEREKPVATTAMIIPPALASGGMPVLGRVVRRFGEPGKTGKNAKGIFIKTRPGGTVVAPRDGRVVFAGPFHGLGKLLIIEYQAKYHLLLAGLARIDTEVGENVLAGEPVGTMKASQGAGSALYVELRRNGQPINPLPWLAAGKTEVNG